MSTSEAITSLFICFSFHFASRNLNLLGLCSNYMMDNFCPTTKTIPDRTSVHTQKWLGLRDFYDEAKLRHSDP